MSAAARAIGVDTRDLRVFLYAKPELLDAALEAEEQALDEAVAAVIEAMRTGDMRRRILTDGEGLVVFGHAAAG